MQIDYSSLAEPVTKEDINNYKNSLVRTRDNYIEKITIAIACVPFLLVFLYLFLPYILTYQIITFLVVMVISTIIFIAVLITKKKINKKYYNSTKLWKFAKNNGLSYRDKISPPDFYHTGSIFKVGDDRFIYDSIKTKSDRVAEIANYQYHVDLFDYNMPVRCGFVMVELDRKLPHIMLDSKSNNLFLKSLGGMALEIKNDQHLKLEGDFNNHFSLFVPKGYERDALYIFTPDLMELLIDETGDFDAEIIENHLYIYSKKAFNFNKVDLLERLFKIIDLVAKKTINRSKNYSDERVGDRKLNAIHNDGRRLSARLISFWSLLPIAFLLFMIIRFFVIVLPDI